MRGKKIALAFEKSLRAYGSRVLAQSRALPCPTIIRCVVDNHRRLYRGYGSFVDFSGTDLGVLMADKNTILIFTPWRRFWDSDEPVRLVYRGLSYDVIYSSTVTMEDAPVYVWAIARPVIATSEHDYDDLGTEQN